jgi:hypothetical protein
MSADTLISVDGLDVIASGSVVVLLNSKISISLSEEDEEVSSHLSYPKFPKASKAK